MSETTKSVILNQFKKSFIGRTLEAGVYHLRETPVCILGDDISNETLQLIGNTLDFVDYLSPGLLDVYRHSEIKDCPLSSRQFIRVIDDPQSPTVFNDYDFFHESGMAPGMNVIGPKLDAKSQNGLVLWTKQSDRIEFKYMKVTALVDFAPQDAAAHISSSVFFEEFFHFFARGRDIPVDRNERSLGERAYSISQELAHNTTRYDFEKRTIIDLDEVWLDYTPMAMCLFDVFVIVSLIEADKEGFSGSEIFGFVDDEFDRLMAETKTVRSLSEFSRVFDDC